MKFVDCFSVLCPILIPDPLFFAKTQSLISLQLVIASAILATAFAAGPPAYGPPAPYKEEKLPPQPFAYE